MIGNDLIRFVGEGPMTESTPSIDFAPVTEKRESGGSPSGGGTGAGPGMAIPGLAVARRSTIRRDDTAAAAGGDDESFFGKVGDMFDSKKRAEKEEKKHQEVLDLRVQRLTFTHNLSPDTATDEQWAAVDDIDNKILKIDPGVLASIDPRFPSRIKPEEGMLGKAEDWLKAKTPDKVKKALHLGVDRAEDRALDEVRPKSGKLDDQLVWGMSMASKRFAQAAKLSADEAMKKKYEEAAEKFAEGAEQGKKIQEIVEDAKLIKEFCEAVEQAADADASKPDGATKLFGAMKIGGKVGAKFIPAPLNTYFDLMSNIDPQAMTNVGRAYGDPDSDLTTEGKAIHDAERTEKQ